jgi:integrase
MRRQRLAAETKTDAIREARDWRVDVARGADPRGSSGLTVNELAADWLSHLAARIGDRDLRRRYAPKTVCHYKQQLNSWILPQLGHHPVADLTVQDVRRLIDRLSAAGLSPSTTSGALNILSGLLRYAVRGGHADRNVARDVDRAERPGGARVSEPRYLNESELERLLARMTDTFRPVAATCAYAATRVSEALALRWGDVDLSAGTLTISGQLGPTGDRLPVKTPASGALVPLLPALARELRELRSRQAERNLALVRSDALVFVTRQGRPQARRNVLRAVHAAGDAAGLNGAGREKVGCHDLRHSFAGVAFASGMSLAEVAVMMRHASAQVTATVYAGLADDGREKAAAKLVEAGFGL